MIEHGDSVLLIDTPTDLRQQALRFGVHRVDAVLYTHAHADHVLGLDELRIFNLRQRSVIRCFGSSPSLAALGEMFADVFGSSERGSPRPRLELCAVEERFEAVAGLEVTPVPLLHGGRPILGYRVGAGRSYFTHLTHEVDHGNIRPPLPPDLELAYDGLVIDLG